MKDLTGHVEWLNYHHLRYFHAIAREGSLRRASEVLRCSQPSICSQVKLLEEALGETLYRRSGRSIALTSFGRVVYEYAESIFSIGRELLSTARRAASTATLRLQVGILDSFPKLLSIEVLKPVFESRPVVQVTCREGKIEDLLGQLASHRLDAILSDEVPPSGMQIKTFSHLLGESGLTFCAAPELAARLKKKGPFPKVLHDAPLLLPTQNTALRREMEKWFEANQIEPVVVGEFEDAALAKIVAAEGYGVTAVPSLVETEAVERYGFVPVGRTLECGVRLFLITAERNFAHPGVALLAKQFAKTPLSKQLTSQRTKSPTKPPKRRSNAETP
ncbi:MAG: transcriptional activator of nhaA [Verrucomicrobia bacterium]|nr:MAG: transcriptional activator of nhaA [Verrucomicrobiota bacterium]